MTWTEYLSQALQWVIVGTLAGVPLGELARPLVLRKRRERELP